MNYLTIKEQVVKEYSLGGVGVRTLAKRYNYHFTTIAKWIMQDKKKRSKKGLAKAGQETARKSNRIHELPTEIPSDIEGLQEALRLAQIKIALLEATIDIADEQMGANIRKKAGARQS